MNHEKWNSIKDGEISVLYYDYFFVTYRDSFKTYEEMFFLSVVANDAKGHATAEIENTSGIDTPALLRSDPF